MNSEENRNLSETCTFCKKDTEFPFSIKDQTDLYCGTCLKKFIKQNKWTIGADCEAAIEDAITSTSPVGGVM